VVGQSPPTVSGVVIISGSNNFDAHASDFPVVVGSVTESVTYVTDPPFSTSSAVDAYASSLPIPLFVTDFAVDIDIPAGFIPDFDDDVDIRSTPVTTSGIVVVDIFPGAGITGPPPYVPPVYFNVRVFPDTSTDLFIRVFPEEGLRIFPVLPQFSTLTPGD
jgi:hypothetical protein